jgi:hypothetical protein
MRTILIVLCASLLYSCKNNQDNFEIGLGRCWDSIKIGHNKYQINNANIIRVDENIYFLSSIKCKNWKFRLKNAHILFTKKLYKNELTREFINEIYVFQSDILVQNTINKKNEILILRAGDVKFISLFDNYKYK